MKYKNYLSKNDYLDHNDARPEVLRLMERWADAMEKLMARGATVAEAAEQTKDRANVEGVTAGYYSKTAEILCTYWEHGDRFKQWWDNECYQKWLSEPDDSGPFISGASEPAKETEKAAPGKIAFSTLKVKPHLKEQYEEFAMVHSTNAYDRSVIDYMDEWASMMEAEIAKGASVGQAAAKTIKAADIHGNSGTTQSIAEISMAYFWERGDELKQWLDNRSDMGMDEEPPEQQNGINIFIRL